MKTKFEELIKTVEEKHRASIETLIAPDLDELELMEPYIKYTKEMLWGFASCTNRFQKTDHVYIRMESGNVRNLQIEGWWIAPKPWSYSRVRTVFLSETGEWYWNREADPKEGGFKYWWTKVNSCSVDDAAFTIVKGLPWDHMKEVKNHGYDSAWFAGCWHSEVSSNSQIIPEEYSKMIDNMVANQYELVMDQYFKWVLEAYMF